MKAILVIGGSDCSSGAGIQRDLEVLFEKKIYGVSVITAITAQNSKKFYSFQPVSKKLLIQQLNAVFSEFDIQFVKIGMLGNSKIVEALAHFLANKKLTIVYDPVIKSSSGGNLIENDNFIYSIKENLFPIIDLLTPNFNELQKLLGYSINNLQEHELKKVYSELKIKNLLIKGGHIPDKKFSTDYLVENNNIHIFSKARVNKEIRGTGCALATSIVSELFYGKNLEEAVRFSKEWLWEKIKKNYTENFL